MLSAGRRPFASALKKSALALVGATLLVAGAWARSGDIGSVSLAELPAEARRTDQLIRSGGPFPYAKDGTVFGNRERLLPREKRGYYREYTVRTPGVQDRGARRIVCGGPQPTAPAACYYTADHYASFMRIADATQ